MTEDQLKAEFKRYILEQKLCTEAAFATSGDATDYLRLPNLTFRQRTWLSGFIRRWDEMVEEQAARMYRLRPKDIGYLRALVEAEAAVVPHSRHLSFPAPDGLLDRLDTPLVATPLQSAGEDLPPR